MSHHAQDERRALCDLFLEVGPTAPTLCEGWLTRDLAAHLVIRERRPDAAVGIVVPWTSGWTGRVQDGEARRPWAELVERVRTGPPIYSPFRLPTFDEAGNTVEFFVHHEDVRRAVDGWEPRDLDDEFAEVLWRRVSRGGRMFFSRSPVGVVLRRTDVDGDPVEYVARPGGPSVTLTGAASELLLRAFGRTQARVEITGDDDTLATFTEARLGL